MPSIFLLPMEEMIALLIMRITQPICFPRNCRQLSVLPTVKDGQITALWYCVVILKMMLPGSIHMEV